MQLTILHLWTVGWHFFSLDCRPLDVNLQVLLLLLLDSAGGLVRSELDLLHRFKLAAPALVDKLVDVLVSAVVPFHVGLEACRLNGRVVAERTLVLALAGVPHLVAAKRVVVAGPVITVWTRVTLVARVTPHVQSQVGRGSRCGTIERNIVIV